MSFARSASLVAAALFATAAAGCGKAPEKAGPGAAKAPGATAPGGVGKIAVPGAGLPSEGGGGALPVLPGGAGAATAPSGPDDTFKVVISPGAGAAGAAQTASVKALPGAGYHINLKYPAYLSLTALDGVALAKPELALADVTKLTDDEIVFDVKATPSKAGSYTLKGEFSFAVCDADSCDPKTQAVEIAVVAN